jgi:hypothetical protein
MFKRKEENNMANILKVRILVGLKKKRVPQNTHKLS